MIRAGMGPTIPRRPLRRGRASAASRRVVEDDAQREAQAAVNPAHPVSHGRAKVSARAGDGSMPGREDDDLALLRPDGLPARLGPRPLFQEEKLSSVVVFARAAQEARELQREGHRAVEILMQAVVASGLVAKQEGSRLALTLARAEGQQFLE